RAARRVRPGRPLPGAGAEAAQHPGGAGAGAGRGARSPAGPAGRGGGPAHPAGDRADLPAVPLSGSPSRAAGRLPVLGAVADRFVTFPDLVEGLHAELPLVGVFVAPDVLGPLELQQGRPGSAGVAVGVTVQRVAGLQRLLDHDHDVLWGMLNVDEAAVLADLVFDLRIEALDHAVIVVAFLSSPGERGDDFVLGLSLRPEDRDVALDDRSGQPPFGLFGAFAGGGELSAAPGFRLPVGGAGRFGWLRPFANLETPKVHRTTRPDRVKGGPSQQQHADGQK